ncbi:MAG: hypothetical protein AAF616_06485 [Bacteroidota bacterium]
MQFRQIPGLEELKGQLLSGYAKGKVAHAQLFSGKPETAVVPMVLAYATYLMCEDKSDEDSCGTCSNCVRIKKLVHPDLHFVFPKVSASDSGKYEKVFAEALPKFRTFVELQPYGRTEDWATTYGQENKNLLITREDSRQMLKNVSMRSVEGGFKILVIWCPEMMHASAANAILKILEEPPENTIYLMATYHYDQLLATITSRTQLISVGPHSVHEIQAYLSQQDIPTERAKQVAKLAEGKLGAAFRLVKEEGSLEYQTFQKWMLECWNGNLVTLVSRSEVFSKSGRSSQRSDLSYAIAMIRSAALHVGGNPLPAQSKEEQSFVSKFGDRLGRQRLEKIYLLTNEALSHLERNSNPRITHLNLSLDITRALNDG